MEFMAIGELIVALAKSTPLVAIVGAIRTWLTGQQQRSIKLEIDGDRLELTGVSSRDQERLIDDWLRRQGPT